MPGELAPLILTQTSARQLFERRFYISAASVFGMNRFPIEHPEKSGFGVWGVWGTNFTVNLKKRVAQKLRRTILLHFRLIPFRCLFGKTRKPIIIMIFGFLDESMTPKTNYSNFGDTKILQKNKKSRRIIFGKYSL